jgi:hypothetical protein
MQQFLLGDVALSFLPGTLLLCNINASHSSDIRAIHSRPLWWDRFSMRLGEQTAILVV